MHKSIAILTCWMGQYPWYFQIRNITALMSAILLGMN